MPQLRLEVGALAKVGAVEPPSRENGAASSALYRKLRPGPGRSSKEVARHQQTRIIRAMIECAATQGYPATTLRDLVRTAGVSTRTFYQHYRDKEECFLHAYSASVTHLLREAEEASRGVVRRDQRVRSTVGAVLSGWQRDRDAAKLMLIEVPAAGFAAREAVRRARRSIGSRLMAACQGDAAEAMQSPWMAEAIAAGLMTVASFRLSKGQDLSSLEGPVTQWVISCEFGSSTPVRRLDGMSRLSSRSRASISPAPECQDKSSPRASDDLELIIAAASKLAAVETCEDITLRRILAAAGVRRRSFLTHFAQVEDCLALVLDRRLDIAFVRADEAGRAGLESAGRANLAVASLCHQIPRDPALVNLCFLGGRYTRAHGLHRLREFLVDIGRSVADGPLRATAHEVRAEASAGALLGVLEGEVDEGTVKRTLQLAPALSYLVLAPAIGASAAQRAIDQKRLLVA